MQIDFETYRKKVLSCYVGKCVGGTLGIKYEGNINYNEVSYYDPIPDKMLPNDDLDLQVVNLETLLRTGLPVCRYNIAEIFKYHMVDHAPDEYGVSISNHALKMNAPLSGIYRNKMNAGMGGAIRSELWACLAPANPSLAATFAREDACTDHYGDGVYAEMFLAAVESAAFIETDLIKLIKTGLSVIPDDAKLKNAFTDVIKWWEKGKTVKEIRELVLSTYYSQNWTDVTINLSFVLLSLISCEGDFDKAVCTAVSLGYDTDCTGATVGSIFGILNPDSIGKKWTDPIGNSLVLSTGIINMHSARTIDDFCNQIISVADQVQTYYNTDYNFSLPADFVKTQMAKPFLDDYTAVYNWEEGKKESLLSTNPLLISLVYPDTVASIPEKENEFSLKIDNVTNDDITLNLSISLPCGWSNNLEQKSYTLSPKKRLTVPFSVFVDGAQNRMPLNLMRITVEFNGIKFLVDAGLPVSFPWLVENLKTGKKSIFEAENIFFTVPKGSYKYTALVNCPSNKEVRLYSGSLRHFILSLNGKEVWDSAKDWYGSRYVPTFHRSGAQKVEMTRKVNSIEVVFPDGEEQEFFMGYSTIYGCAVWIDTMERMNFNL